MREEVGFKALGGWVSLLKNFRTCRVRIRCAIKFMSIKGTSQSTLVNQVSQVLGIQ